MPFSFSGLFLFSPSSVFFFPCLSSFSLSLISLLSPDVLSVFALFCLCWLSICRSLVWVGWMAGVGLPNVLFFSHGECRSHPLSRYGLTFSLVPRQVETFDTLKYRWMAYSLLLPRFGATILPLLHPWIGPSTFPTNMVWLLCPSYELGRACQAFPTHLLLPPPPTKIVFSSYHYHLPLLRYLHYFTTLLLTPTTYLHSSFASAIASSSTFTSTLTTPPSLLYYFTTSLLLLTLTTFAPFLGSFADGRLAVFWGCR